MGHDDLSSGENPMFTLTTDTVGNRIAGYTLRGPEGAEVFSTMHDVLLRVADVPAAQCVWASLADALIDLTWRQDQWGDFTTSQTVSYWADGEVKKTTVNHPQGQRLEWDDVLGA